MNTEETKQLKRENRKLKKHLKDLTVGVRKCLDAIDEAMKMPSTVDRGKRIAEICNWWEFENDSARYFGLDIDYRKDKK